MILAQWYFSDRLVLFISGAKKVTREQFPELHDMIERIIARNNLPKPQIAVINTRLPNAFATGRSPKSSVVAVTTGLIDLLDSEELEGVLAHELTHIRNRDVLVITLASLFSTVAWYLMQFGFYGAGIGYGYGARDDRSNSAGAMIAVIVVAMLTWLISFLIIRAISRYREFSADRGAAQMTGKPAKLANALMKVSGNMRPSTHKRFTSCRGFKRVLYNSCIVRQHDWKSLFYPSPVEKRIKKLMEMEASMS